jgi:hypothetical protein
LVFFAFEKGLSDEAELAGMSRTSMAIRDNVGQVPEKSFHYLQSENS